MSPELEQKLIAKYPTLYRETSMSPQSSCMAFGFEVGDGWYDLLEILSEALTYTYTTSIEVDEEDGKIIGIKPYEWNKEKARYFYQVEPPTVIATQVKEKFGSLRFYYKLEFSETNKALSEKYAELKEVNKRYADYIDGTIHFAETASYFTCEKTGKKGELMVRRGWLKVLAPDIGKELGYEKYINRSHEEETPEAGQKVSEEN